jgi:hypothetical protein
MSIFQKQIQMRQRGRRGVAYFFDEKSPKINFPNSDIKTSKTVFYFLRNIIPPVT